MADDNQAVRIVEQTMRHNMHISKLRESEIPKAAAAAVQATKGQRGMNWGQIARVGENLAKMRD